MPNCRICGQYQHPSDATEHRCFPTELNQLRTELAAAREDKLRIVRGEFAQICSYCGWESADGGWDELQAHIHNCEKHPVFLLTHELAAARKEIARLRVLHEEMVCHLDYTQKCLGVADQDLTAAREEIARLNAWVVEYQKEMRTSFLAEERRAEAAEELCRQHQNVLGPQMEKEIEKLEAENAKLRKVVVCATTLSGAWGNNGPINDYMEDMRVALSDLANWTPNVRT